MNIFQKLLFLFVSVYISHSIDIRAEEDINEKIKSKLKKNSYGGFSESFDYSVSKDATIDNVNNILKLGGDADSRVFLKSKIRPLSLLSNTATIDLNNNTIMASAEEKTDKKTGKRIRSRVEVKINNDRVLFADKFTYNFSSQNGFVNDALFLYKDYVIRCQKARMDYDGTFYGENVFFTTCKYAYPSWGFTIKNAVYNKSFILGKGVGFMFLGKKLNIPIPFIYFFPAKEKTGFVYPTGIWFDTFHGLYFDPGFYFYFGECADLLIRLKWYTSGSSELSVRHRYIKNGSYEGNVFFIYNFVRLDPYSTDTSSSKRSPLESYFLQWDNSSHRKFYKNKGRLSLYSDDLHSQNQKAEFSMNHSFLRIPFFSSIPLSHGYNKNFKTKLETWDIIDTFLSHSFSFLSIFDFNPSLRFKSRSSNEDVDVYVRDENDFDFDDADDAEDEDDGGEELVFYGPQNRKKKVDISKFYSDSWKDYFKEDYWMKVWEQRNSGADINLPLCIDVRDLKWIRIYSSLIYNAKLYGSFLAKGEDGKYVLHDLLKTNKKLAFIHDFNSLLNATISSPEFSFSYNAGEVVSFVSIPVSFSYSPSSEFMHDTNRFPASIVSKFRFFEVKKPYEDEGQDQVSIFSHSVLGNVNNCQEGKLKFGFNFRSYYNGESRDKIFSFSVSGGYDFLADDKKTFKWQNINIKIDAPFFLGFNYETSINLYEYAPLEKIKESQIVDKNNINQVSNAIKINEDNNIANIAANNEDNEFDANNAGNKNVKKYRRTGKLFWDHSNEGFKKKNFLFHRFGFNLPISQLASKHPLRDSDGYSRFNILNNFYFVFSYNFTYAYNPVYDKQLVSHSCNLRLNGKLTKKWEFFSNLSLRKKNDKPLECVNSYFGIRRALCDCWMIYICISYDKNNMSKKKDFRCMISLRPLDDNISIFEQRRVFNVGV